MKSIISIAGFVCLTANLYSDTLTREFKSHQVINKDNCFGSGGVFLSTNIKERTYSRQKYFLVSVHLSPFRKSKSRKPGHYDM